MVWTILSEREYGVVIDLIDNILPLTIRHRATIIQPAIKEFSGEWRRRAETHDVARLNMIFSVKSFNIPRENRKVRLYDISTKAQISEKITDEKGNVRFALEYDKPGAHNYVATLLKRPIPSPIGPLSEYIPVKIYLLKIDLIPVNDTVTRHIGRSYINQLPQNFWEHDKYELGELKGEGSYYELIPLTYYDSLIYEIGTSAPEGLHWEVVVNIWESGKFKAVGKSIVNVNKHPSFVINYRNVEIKKIYTIS